MHESWIVPSPTTLRNALHAVAGHRRRPRGSALSRPIESEQRSHLADAVSAADDVEQDLAVRLISRSTSDSPDFHHVDEVTAITLSEEDLACTELDAFAHRLHGGPRSSGASR